MDRASALSYGTNPSPVRKNGFGKDAGTGGKDAGTGKPGAGATIRIYDSAWLRMCSYSA